MSIWADQGERVQKVNSNELPLPCDVRPRRMSTSWLGFRTRELVNRVAYRSDWVIQYKFDHGLSTTFENLETILPPLSTWWGDPHLAFKDGRYYIFFEELPFAGGNHRAHISVLTIDSKGQWSGPQVVLEKPFHLSYPHVFRHQDKYYMIPESAHNRTIDLYEAEEFPWRWKLKSTIMSGVAAYDSTILYRDGLWWLFCTMVKEDRASANSELYLFYSDDLLSDHWESHPKNPIVADAISARPAGAIIENGHGLLRPSQDCYKCYGHAININRIEELNERSYKEVRVDRIEPSWNKRISRVHTLNHLHGLTVIDAYLERRRFFNVQRYEPRG